MRIFVFKPDGIGDFVLATGALRVMASAVGEENLAICVRNILVPLAASQFPKATIIELPTASTRQVINLFAWNLYCCAPLWWKLRHTSYDASVCLRSMRNYLETLMFYAPRTERYVACENILMRGTSKRTRARVESGLARFFRTEFVPYPEKSEVPLEIEAHRRLTSQLLRREVAVEEVIPSLITSAPRHGGYWICAPVTNLASKVYPFAMWAEVFRELKPEAADKRILLVGTPGDRPRLAELLDLLHAEGFTKAEIFHPADLTAFVDLIAGAELMLTVDTAAAHFATALDIPALVLFSGLHRGMFGHWRRSEKQSWVLPGIPPGKKKPKWPTGIPPALAATEVRKVLKIANEEKTGHSGSTHNSCSHQSQPPSQHHA